MAELPPQAAGHDPAQPGGNFYPKYTTYNPVGRFLVNSFLADLLRLVRRSGASEVHDIGCGEGFLSTMLGRHGFRVRGCDVAPAAVAAATRRAADLSLPTPFAVADLYDLTAGRDDAELVICCEVLEHLSDPEQALRLLARLARPHLIVSVPREPLWRILNVGRGRYLRHLGNTPGHLQHWSKGAFLSLLERHFEICEVRTPIPWTMALCRRP